MIDPTPEVTFLNGWTLKICEGVYILLCFGIAVLIRVIGSLMKSFENHLVEHQRPWRGNLSYGTKFRHIFIGFNNEYDQLSDHWLGFIIGLAEVSIFPLLMRTGSFFAIGGWLGLKAVVGFKVWQESQRAYNRMLVQNILNLAASYALAQLVFY